MRVLALSGSIRQGSVTRLVLGAAMEGAQSAGAGVHHLSLDAPPLPLFGGNPSGDPAVVEFRAHVQACDALLVATPVYHDSYSGLLKNALDYLLDELRDKVVGLMAVGGGRAGGGIALDHLRAVMREMNAWTLNRQVIVTSAGQAFDAQGLPRDPETGTRLRQLGQEVVLQTRALRQGRPPSP